MADIRRHGTDIAGTADDPRARRAGLLVLDFPDDLVGELHEPFDAIVAVLDRQDELLGSRAVKAVLHHRAD